MNKVFNILTLLAISAMGHSALAQYSSQLGAFDFLPQSVVANPALRPKGHLNISIPGLGNTYVAHGNNFFKIKDHLSDDGNGTATLEAARILDNIDQFAVLEQGAGLELFHVGLRIDKHYFHVRAAERVQFGIKLPKDIFNLTVYGNAGSYNFENNTADFSGLSIDGMHYREYALGYNYEWNDKLTFGLTAKYLYGMERVQTGLSTLTLRTDPNTYDLQSSGGLLINTAGIYGLASDEENDAVQDDLKNYLFGLKNSGFAGDFGVVYRPLEKLQLEFSSNDIGFIKWKSDVANYGTDDASFAFNGVDLTDFLFAEGSDFNDGFEAELDSLLDDLESTYNFDRRSENFSTGVNGYLRYAASYDVLEADGFSGKAYANLVHGLGQSQMPLTISVGYNQKFWKAIQADLHVSKRKYYDPAFGAGLSANAGPVQIYVLAENFRFARLTKVTITDKENPDDQSSFVYFNNPQDIRVNVGVNLTFGIKKDDSPGGRPMKR